MLESEAYLSNLATASTVFGSIGMIGLVDCSTAACLPCFLQMWGGARTTCVPIV